MNEVGALVEGQTEQTFVREVLAPHLAARGIRLWARLPGPIGHRGIRKWQSVRGEIVRTLKEGKGRLVCTTMFDFYGMPGDWPGRADAGTMLQDQKGPIVEQAMLADLGKFAGKDFRREWFIPYVQVHEFEALLFSDVSGTAKALTESPGGPEDLAQRFQAILDEAGQPEAINDNWETCPSRRVKGLVQAYDKVFHGPRAAARIGLDIIRQSCPHFRQWIERLERLPAVQ